MMKLWSHLFFLVLAISALSRGENKTSGSEASETPDSSQTQPPQSHTKSVNEGTRMQPESRSHTSGNETDLTSTAFAVSVVPNFTTSTNNEGKYDNDTGAENSGREETPMTTSLPGIVTERGDTDATTTGSRQTVSTETHSTATTPLKSEVGPSSGGYIILVFIILVIILLCTILYFLRRAAKTHSFDLQRPVSTNHLTEPIGTFEPVHLDDLDRPAPHDRATTDDLLPPPAVNGTTPQSEENDSYREYVNATPQEQPDVNSLKSSLTSNTSNSSPTLGDDPVDKASSPLTSMALLFDAVVEDQQNENNNNNPSVCSSEPFVEINLDDPGWCEQLFSTDAPPSAASFSPFSSS